MSIYKNEAAKQNQIEKEKNVKSQLGLQENVVKMEAPGEKQAEQKQAEPKQSLLPPKGEQLAGVKPMNIINMEKPTEAFKRGQNNETDGEFMSEVQAPVLEEAPAEKVINEAQKAKEEAQKAQKAQEEAQKIQTAPAQKAREEVQKALKTLKENYEKRDNGLLSRLNLTLHYGSNEKDAWVITAKKMKAAEEKKTEKKEKTAEERKKEGEEKKKAEERDRSFKLLAMKAAALNGEDDIRARKDYLILKIGSDNAVPNGEQAAYIEAVERVIHAILSAKPMNLPEGVQMDQKAYSLTEDLASMSKLALELIEKYRAMGEREKRPLRRSSFRPLKRAVSFSVRKNR